MLNIAKTKYIWFTFSGALVLGSLVLLLTWGLKPSIDFTGGTLFEIEFASRPQAEDLRVVVVDAINTTQAGEGEEATTTASVALQTFGDNGFIIRSNFISNDARKSVLTAMEEKFGKVEERSFETIGPVIGAELKQKSYVAIVVVLVFIITYISWAFRKVKTVAVSSWKMGVAAIVALAHDLLVIVGLFVLLGRFGGVEVGTMFVTALLTVLGFSVHDTIVVFDRLRERIQLGGAESFEEKVNQSVNSTLMRSINTSATTLFVLMALYLFGGASIQYFVLALIVGIVSGTYSSIFIASPLLLLSRRK